MNSALRKPRVGVVLALCLLLVALHTAPAEAEGRVVNAGEFVEGLNVVAWDDPSGPSHPSSLVEELEQLSGLTAIAVYWFNVPLQVWETYIPGAPAFTNTLRELPASAILTVRLQCAALLPGTEFFFEEGVPCEERRAAIDGLNAARSYATSLGTDVGKVSAYLGGVNFLAPAYVARVGDVSLTVARQRLQGSTGQMRRNTVFINRDNGGWQQASSTVRASVAAHEVFHIVPVDLGCT